MWGDSDLQKLAGTAKRYTPEYAADTCGTHNVMSVANLQMLLGNMGVEYGGVNALRGQNNVQGTCDMGALPNVYPGHQRVTDPSLREKFEKAWGVEGLPAENGLMIPQMMEGLVDKKVRAKVTDQVPEGMVWMAFLFRETCANWLAPIRSLTGLP